MISEKELEVVTLSPTKKDFYQIWNELLETAQKLSSRWDPSATNESDPGVVLLKVLAALGDKLNYNIDKNILEAFMPSASQQESMRKLCEMMGYYMKYYRSAKTTATIAYKGSWDEIANGNGITIPKYTTLSDEDDQINYVTLDSITLYQATPFDTVECIEGQICQCENSGNVNNLITPAQLDDNFKYYLPESQIAENGIFIYTSSDGLNYTEWTREDNLNIQQLGYTCYKVGFDSKKKIPYLQFPTDVASLMGDGLSIYYIRTSGVNGNISAKTLNKLSKPDAWSTWASTESSSYYGNLSVDNFTVTNASAAMNGYNMETIDEAYNSYKKTIGTFDTLVTCRDYMNKIYQLTEDEVSTIPLVSNIIASDIRDDINNSFSLCSFNDYGIKYTDMTIANRRDNEEKLSHFDIVLYPFKTVKGLNTKTEYDNSFKFSRENITEIENDLENYKTISHTFRYPSAYKAASEGFADIICIKNYLRLNAKITTTYKVNTTEESSILSAIYSSIYNDFNLRKLDFGEAIPFDTILKCIENADTRIKNVSLEEPILYTTFLTADNKEWDIASTNLDTAETAKRIYNKLALRNILAGKIALLRYNEDFKFEFSESKYPSGSLTSTANTDNITKTNSTAKTKTKTTNTTSSAKINDNETHNYLPIYPERSEQQLIRLESECHIYPGDTELTLNDNEVIQFRAPSFKTKLTYPAYVNYYIKLINPAGEEAIAAQFTTLGEFLAVAINANSDRWDDLMEKKSLQTFFIDPTCSSAEQFSELLNKYGALWQTSAGITRVTTYGEVTGGKVYGLPINGNTFGKINEYVKSLSFTLSGQTYNYTGLYRSLGWSSTRVPGYLTTVDCIKYHLANTYNSSLTLTTTYVQLPNAIDTGLGKDAVLGGISKNEEYQLKEEEYLLINYTETSDSNDSTTSENIKNIKYSSGTIIKPNFLLSDSFTKNQTGGIAFTKTTGFEFAELDKSEGKNGMYALGTSEQIEIRDTTELKLGYNETLGTYQNVYVYWDLNAQTEKNNTANGYVTFPFKLKEEGVYTYTLGNSEYFYFTDANKTDLNYYGEGTEIIKNGNWALRKAKSTSETTDSEAILAQGMSAIPWEKLSFNENNNLVFREFQYINLVKDDKLISLSNSIEEAGHLIDLELNNDWQSCKSAEYILSTNSSTSKLQKLTFNDPNIKWEVRSLLQFNMGNSLTQTLHRDAQRQDSIKAWRYRTSSDVSSETEILVDTFTPLYVESEPGKGEYVPLSLRSNYTCQAANDKVSVKIYKESLTDANSTEEINDFKLKLFEDVPPQIQSASGTTIVTGGNITLNNFGDHWTKISTSELKSQEGSEELNKLILHINIPTATESTTPPYYGLVMFYVVTGTNTTQELPYLKFTNALTGTKLKIFNLYDEAGEETWWTNYLKNKAIDLSNTNYWKEESLQEYSSTKTYDKYAIVNVGTSYYISKQKNNKGNDLTNTDFWYSQASIENWKSDYAYSIYEVASNDENKYYVCINGDYYYLRAGINVVKLDTSMNLEMYPDSTYTANIIFGDIDIINNTTKGINLDVIKYNYVTPFNNESDAAEDQLLENINTWDTNHDFYYNCPIERSEAIDINTTLNSAGVPIETLSTETIWYDYNNVNNKFVISEIDSIYMKSGISLTKSSKRGY